jgi:FkbM family methyltransferase
MKLVEGRGLRFHCRPGSSDEKAFNEVILKKSYERRDFQILPGEHWLDLGANVGAFSVLATSLGAKVTAYEPDPVNLRLTKENLALNGLMATLVPQAVVHDDRTSVELNLWPDGQSWRNSIVRNKRGTTPITVFCANFYKLAKPADCVKMDIEGAEIELLENWPEGFKVKKLVFEYSFDVDQSVERLRKIIKRLSPSFAQIKYSSQVDTIDRWSFFPPCTMVRCY